MKYTYPQINRQYISTQVLLLMAIIVVILARRGIEEFNNSEWATPIVPILKKDETTCICGNYNVKLNKVCKLYSYPIPRIDDLYANLAC